MTGVLTELYKSVTDYSLTQVILVAVTVLLVVRYLTKKKYKLPPGPRPLPLLGNILAFKGRPMTDVFKEWQQKYGPVFTMYAGPIKVIILNDIDVMTEAFVKQGSDFSGRPFIHSMDKISDGSKDIAFSTYGEVWKYQRKLAVTALRQYLTGRQLETRVHEAVTPIIESMLEEKGYFDPHGYNSLCVFNVVHGLCFGNIFQQNDPNFINLLKLFDDFNDGFGNGLIEDFFPPLRLWPTARYKYLMSLADKFNNYIYAKLAEHQKDFDENDMKSLADNIVLAQKQSQEEGSKLADLMTDVHFGQTLADVFGAGVDTTRAQLDWIIYTLAARPDIQAKIHKQLDDILGDNVPGKEHRAKLPYLEAVMLESMRLQPVLPAGLPHSTIKDTTVGGYEIPSNTWVIVNHVEIMRSPQHWEDPLEFKPERFLDETGTRVVLRHQSWIPFSSGQRSCMGESLAKLEMFYILAGLLQKLTFTLDPSCSTELVKPTEGLQNRPAPFKVKVTVR